MDIKEQLEQLTIEQIQQVLQYIQDLNAHNPKKEVRETA